ncbi:MAG TPA: DUF6644 family protein [Micropepsaceae bacterium]|nr:DUF6644 family protein [Micropepsaceae bacterium]
MSNPFVDALQWLNDTQMAEAIRDSVWIFPALETIHVVAIVIVVGSIMRLDLRLAGLVWRNRPVTEVSDEMLPWTWISFVIATIFGLLLFASKPLTYLGIAFFDVKMILIALAGLNMLVFQHVTFKGVAVWDRAPFPPTAVRLAGSLSLAFWISVLVCGRLIGFV